MKYSKKQLYKMSKTMDYWLILEDHFYNGTYTQEEKRKYDNFTRKEVMVYKPINKEGAHGY